MPTPTPTPTRTDAPTRSEPQDDPDRRYNPERLCPSQRQDATRWSMP